MIANIRNVCIAGNVVWLDKTSPARALLGLSRPISGLLQSGKQKMEEVLLVEEDEGEEEEEDIESAAEQPTVYAIPSETPVIAPSLDKQVDINFNKKCEFCRANGTPYFS
jgi:hypothetical protein